MSARKAKVKVVAVAPAARDATAPEKRKRPVRERVREKVERRLRALHPMD